MSELARRLGYPGDARLLIVTANDLGSSHAATVGGYQVLTAGAATTAGLMVPCPWARHAAASWTDEDMGVQLTLNAEYEQFRWGPITQAPSLLDGDGGFPRTREDLWDHADLEEVRREGRAQIERALLWGVDVSHLDSHLASLELRPEFFDVALELAGDFHLPMRLPSAAAERQAGFPFRQLAAEAGIVFPDHFLSARRGGARTTTGQLAELPAGVTELQLRPAVGTAELRAMATDWFVRVDDLAWATEPEGLRACAASAGAVLIGYRELRQVQRAG